MTPATATAPDTLRDDARAAQRELEALRAALELRLQALETALASPDGSESLERLVLDLSRTATDEAQAAARRACLQAQVDAEAQVVAVRATAQKALDVERSASAEARTAAAQLTTALEQERAGSGALRRTLEEARAALERNQARLNDALATLEAERAAAAQLRLALEESGRQRAESEQARTEGQVAREQLVTELEQERSAGGALRLMLSETRTALEKTHAALEDERALQSAHRGDIDAARRDIEALKEQLLEAERARREAEARAEAGVVDQVAILTDDVLEVADTESAAVPLLSGPDEHSYLDPDDTLSAGQQPIRRANRYQLRENVQILIDSDPARLVDVSTRGAQVLSMRTLRPNSVVKVRLPFEENSIGCRAKVVWAQLEPPSRNAALQYRAGLSFTNIDEAAIRQFVAYHGHHEQDV